MSEGHPETLCAFLGVPVALGEAASGRIPVKTRKDEEATDCKEINHTPPLRRGQYPSTLFAQLLHPFLRAELKRTAGGREREGERERDTHTHTHRDRDRERERDRQTDRDREREREHAAL